MTPEELRKLVEEFTDADRELLDGVMVAADTIERLQRENAELEKKVDRCEVGKPYSSRSRDQSHAEQIAYLQKMCGKASVIFTCDCGFQMEGPYDASEWTCAKCRTGRLIPEPLRRIAELEQENAALRQSIELCSGSCRLPDGSR